MNAQPDPVAAHGPLPAPTLALAALSLSTLLSSLGTSSANVALPSLARAFDASLPAVQWVVLAYLVTLTALVVIAGRVGDAVGRRRLLLAGLAVFAAASLACGAAPSLLSLVAARVVQGAGAAVMMALTLAFVGEAVPAERTGRAMGWLGTMSAVGTALGPSLGGFVIAGWGWRAVFFVNVPLALAAIALAARALPRDRATRTGSTAAFDLRGALLLASTLAVGSLAMTFGRGAFGVTNVVLIAVAIVGAVAFVRVESGAASPLVRITLLRDRTLAAAFATSVLVMTVMMATLLVGPFHLSGALGLDAAGVGLAMSCGPVVSALAGVPAGRLVDRYGAQRMTLAGLAGLTTGTLLLAVSSTRWGVAGYVVPLVVVTAGYATFQAANNTQVMTRAAAGERGVVSGLVNLSRNLGLVIGASVIGAVFAAGVGTTALASAQADAIAAGMRLTFVVCAALAGVAVAIAAAVRPSQAS